MGDTLTTTTQVGPAISTYYNRVLLRAAEPELVHEQLAQMGALPSKSGNTVKWRRYALLSPATTPLPEGVDPPGTALSKTDLTAQISWYGDYVHITDVVDLTVEDQTLNITVNRQGQQKAATRDALIRDVLAACASSTNASGGTNGQTPTEITDTDIEGVVKTLMVAHADKIRPAVKASTGVGTAPVAAAYVGISDSYLWDDFKGLTSWKPVHEYPTTNGVMRYEEGSTEKVRWLMTSEGYMVSGTPDVYHLMILGADAFGVTDLRGAAQTILHGFGSGGVSSPLNRKATSGWKMAFCCRLLNDSFMHILKATHSSAGS